MSPSPLEDDPAAPLGALGPHAVDETTSDSADITQAREHGTSEHGADSLDRLEGLIGNLMRDLARERVERAQQHPAEPDTRMGSGSSVFSQFLAAERNRARAESLSEAMACKCRLGCRRIRRSTSGNFSRRISLLRKPSSTVGTSDAQTPFILSKCFLAFSSRYRLSVLILYSSGLSPPLRR